jgi:hypothetical protein
MGSDSTLFLFKVQGKMNDEKAKEIEEKIAHLKGRWPAHSVPPSMWQELEDLEDELEKIKKYSRK